MSPRPVTVTKEAMDAAVAALQEPVIVPTIPEAGGVAYANLWGVKSDEEGVQHVVQINVTCRGVNGIEALDSLLQTIKHAKENYHMHPWQVVNVAGAPKIAGANTPAPGATLAVPIVSKAPPPIPAVVTISAPTPTAPTVAPVPAAPPASVAEDATANELGGELACVKIDVVPRADGKTQVSFWGAGRKYADLQMVRTPEQIVMAFAKVGAWEVAHFQTIASFDVNLKVGWIPSENKTSKGNPYKNIQYIIPGA